MATNDTSCGRTMDSCPYSKAIAANLNKLEDRQLRLSDKVEALNEKINNNHTEILKEFQAMMKELKDDSTKHERVHDIEQQAMNKKFNDVLWKIGVIVGMLSAAGYAGVSMLG